MIVILWILLVVATRIPELKHTIASTSLNLSEQNEEMGVLFEHRYKSIEKERFLQCELAKHRLYLFSNIWNNNARILKIL